MGLYSRHIFPRLMDWALGTRIVGRMRDEALEPANGHVLEIGFGTGLNLSHYPSKVTRLTVVEPRTALERRVQQRIAEARMPIEQFKLDASGRLPFEDASFDSVVTTFTLCSIDDVASALAEMRRVLKADGRYIFLEHGRSDDPRTARRQDRFNPIQRIVGDGCNVNRRIDSLIRESGFDIEKLDRFVMPDTPRLFGEMYRGTARGRI